MAANIFAELSKTNLEVQWYPTSVSYTAICNDPPQNKHWLPFIDFLFYFCCFKMSKILLHCPAESSSLCLINLLTIETIDPFVNSPFSLITQGIWTCTGETIAIFPLHGINVSFLNDWHHEHLCTDLFVTQHCQPWISSSSAKSLQMFKVLYYLIVAERPLVLGWVFVWPGS